MVIQRFVVVVWGVFLLRFCLLYYVIYKTRYEFVLKTYLLLVLKKLLTVSVRENRLYAKE